MAIQGDTLFVVILILCHAVYSIGAVRDDNGDGNDSDNKESRTNSNGHQRQDLGLVRVLSGGSQIALVSVVIRLKDINNNNINTNNYYVFYNGRRRRLVYLLRRTNPANSMYRAASKRR